MHATRSSSAIWHVLLLLAWLHAQPGVSSSDILSTTAAGQQFSVPACTPAPKDLTIPRIIHRNYMEGRAAMYAATQVKEPSWQLYWLLSCKAHHPSWSEMVWSETDILGLINEEYPWFMKTYQTYVRHVFRSDLARFPILHKHGGVYLDADVECYKNMESSLAGLDLVLNCRTSDVAHNAAMASIAGHPVWIEAMKSAMSVVERLRPMVSGDPMTATGPVLVSQTVQQYYGISKDEFCSRVHVKDGLVFKAYSRGQWFTPCWPWSNMKCFKKLETNGKFLVRSDPGLSDIVGVHQYSGTWWSSADTKTKHKQRQNDRMLASKSTVDFFWESPHFAEYDCSSSGTAGSSSADHSSSSLVHPREHKRPRFNSTREVVHQLLRKVQNVTQTNPEVVATATTATPATAAAIAAAGPIAVGLRPKSNSSMFSCSVMKQLASLKPCLVLSVLLPDSNKVLEEAVQTPVTASTIYPSNSTGSAYWKEVQSMLGTWQEDLSCHVTIASPDPSITSQLEQQWSHLPTTTTIIQLSMPLTPSKSQRVSRILSRDAQSNMPRESAAAADDHDQGLDASQLLASLLHQQRQKEAHELGCHETHDYGSVFLSLILGKKLVCKSPPRHAVLHLSSSADFLVDLSEQLYSYNAQASHASFEKHGRYPGAVHSSQEDQNLSGGSLGGMAMYNSSSSGVPNVQSIISVLDTIDVLLVDVEHPGTLRADGLQWNTLYNVLYQMHGYVGFFREALPGGKTRLGWIRRPERYKSTDCSKPKQQQHPSA